MLTDKRAAYLLHYIISKMSISQITEKKKLQKDRSEATTHILCPGLQLVLQMS